MSADVSNQAAKAAAQKAARQAAIKSFAQLVKSAGKAVAKSLLRAFSISILPWLALGLLVVIVIVGIVYSIQTLVFPVGFFNSNNGASSAPGAISVSEIMNTVNSSWDDKLNSLSNDYERQGYKLSVI